MASDNVIKMFKAVSDPVRYLILKITGNRDQASFSALRDEVTRLLGLSLNSAKLAYHLRVLIEADLVEKLKNNNYRLTEKGNLLYGIINDLETKLIGPTAIHGKVQYLCEAVGNISIRDSEFDHIRLHKILESNPFFEGIYCGKDHTVLRWKDPEIRCEIILFKNGDFRIHITLPTDEPFDKIFDLEDDEKFGDVVEGIAYTVYYYIKRYVKILWPNGQVSLDNVDTTIAF